MQPFRSELHLPFEKSHLLFQLTLLNHIGYVDKTDHLERLLSELDDAGPEYAVTGYPDGMTCEVFGQMVLRWLKNG